MFAHVAVQRPMGEVSEARMAFVSCPACSYFRQGECVVCEDDELHPACEGCSGGSLVWYRRPLVASIMTAVAVGVVTSVILNRASKTRLLKNMLR